MTTTSAPDPAVSGKEAIAAATKRDRSHWLYIAVIGGMILGIIVGFVAPDVANKLLEWFAREQT